MYSLGDLVVSRYDNIQHLMIVIAQKGIINNNNFVCYCFNCKAKREYYWFELEKISNNERKEEIYREYEDEEEREP